MQTLKVVRTGRPPKHPVYVKHPVEAYSLLAPKVCHLDREHFMVLHLDAKHRVLAQETISVGCLTEAMAHPREVFKGAFLNGSAVVMLVHNHPSGDPLPSPADLEITQRLREVGELLGIPVLDHLILGDHCYFSFANNIAGPGKDRRARTADPAGDYPGGWGEVPHA